MPMALEALGNYIFKIFGYIFILKIVVACVMLYDFMQ